MELSMCFCALTLSCPHQWTFVSIASASALLYLAIFLVTLFRVLREIRRKQKELSSLAPSAQLKFSGLFSSLRFFLVVTTIVAVCSVLTVVLPSEVLLHHWQHNTTEYNMYSEFHFVLFKGTVAPLIVRYKDDLSKF